MAPASASTNNPGAVGPVDCSIVVAPRKPAQVPGAGTVTAGTVVDAASPPPPPPRQAASSDTATASSTLRVLTGPEASDVRSRPGPRGPGGTLIRPWPRSRSASGTRPTPSCSSSTATTSVSPTPATSRTYEARSGRARRRARRSWCPVPWARDAAGDYRGEDVGVHLTLNAELGDLPLGPDHHLAEPPRRRRRVPPHGRGRLGPRRPRRGPPRVPRADRTGDRVGLRREPPRQPHRRRCSAGRSSSTSTSSWPSTSGSHCASATTPRNAWPDSPSAASRPRRASCSRTASSRAPRGAPADRAVCSSTSPPASRS